jgi:hypothetical protein
VSVQYGSHVWSTLLIPVNKGQQRCGLCFFCLRGIFCGPSQLNIFRRKLFFSVRWPMMRWAKKFRGPGSGLENLVFDSTYGPVAYSLLLDHKGPGRSAARKTKFSRLEPRPHFLSRLFISNLPDPVSDHDPTLTKRTHLCRTPRHNRSFERLHPESGMIHLRK